MEILDARRSLSIAIAFALAAATRLRLQGAAAQAHQRPRRHRRPRWPGGADGRRYTRPPRSRPVLDAEALEELLAPIALYPDPILSQVLIASTNPQEVLDAGNWMLENQSLTGKALDDAAAADRLHAADPCAGAISRTRWT